MGSRVIALRRKLASGNYELTQRAKDEMEQDGFVLDDVKQGIYSGRGVKV